MISVEAAGFALLSYIAINIIFVIMFERRINKHDEDYQFWRNHNPKTSKFILLISALVSFKIIRLKYSYLYGFDNFKARFTKPDEFRKLLIRFTFAHVILTNCVIIGIDVLNLLNSFSISSQIKIQMIESGAIAVIMIIMQFFELCKVRRLLITGYHMMELDSLSFNSQAEEKVDKQIRRDMLKKIMQQFKGTQDLINDTNFNKRDELI